MANNERMDGGGRMEVHPNAKEMADMQRFWGLRQEELTVRPKVEGEVDPDNPGTIHAKVDFEARNALGDAVAHTIDELAAYLTKGYDKLIWEALETCGFTGEYVILHSDEFELLLQGDNIRWVTYKGEILFGVERKITTSDEGVLATLCVIGPPDTLLHLPRKAEDMQD